MFTHRDLTEDLAWSDLINEMDLLELLLRLLVPGMSGDDVVLECVSLVAAFALEPDCGQLLCGTRLPRMIADMIRSKQEDTGVLIQVNPAACESCPAATAVAAWCVGGATPHARARELGFAHKTGGGAR